MKKNSILSFSNVSYTMTMISIQLGSALSEHKALFWRTQEVEKDMLVETLIQTRLPDMSFYDPEDVYAVNQRTNEILDKDERLWMCGLEVGDKIKIEVLTPEKVADSKRRSWRPIHPECRFAA
uniref:Uncharacterized protein n=1 Tax=Pithovirus LCPAC304 TaxID=2506594 RepID=A0A481Z8G0_9VIRU|nr:MAG: hypothetical protein LCPAC304_01030 [Pithovirus LCPAC304]